MTDQLPPHNLEAEASVLGSILIQERWLDDAVMDVRLKPDHFYRARHRLIFAAMLMLKERGEPIDAVTVCDELVKGGIVQEDGVLEYVHALPHEVPLASNAGSYAQAVRDHARMRNFLAAGHAMTKAAYAHDEDGVLSAIQNLGLGEDDGRLPTIESRKEALFDLLSRDKNDAMGWPIPTLNELTFGGARPGNLTIVGGYASHGKSAFVVQCLEHWRSRGWNCALYTNEMTVDEVDLRWLSSVSAVPFWRLMKMQLRDEDRTKLLRKINDLSLPIVPVEGWSAQEIAFHVRRSKWDACAIDLVNAIPHKDTNDIDNNMRTLTACSRQAQAHILGCQHLSKASWVGKPYPPEPTGSDLRGSGQLYDLANNVLFVYLEEDSIEPGRRGDQAIIKLDKARNGIPGRVAGAFKPNEMRFIENTSGGTTGVQAA